VPQHVCRRGAKRKVGMLETTKLTKGASLADKAYEHIRELILTNKLAPGQPLKESQLARSLGISRYPLKQALGRLELEGLVENIQWKGAVVSGLTSQFIRDLYEIRTALEALSVRKAATSLADEDLEELENLWQSSALAVERSDYRAWEDSDQIFHSGLGRRCGNELLPDYLAKLRGQLARIRNFMGHIPGMMECSYEEHRQLLEALRARDPEASERAMWEHLGRVSDRIIRAIDSAHQMPTHAGEEE
jgi:DNA-binding GntR family transcriptional regulator